MKRFTEAMVLVGSEAASARARAPTTTAPSAAYCTTDGKSNAPPSSTSKARGFPSTTAATSELVVPRSMPTAWPRGFRGSWIWRSPPAIAQ